MIVTSYGRNKNLDDETKKMKRRPIIASAIASRLLNVLPNFLQKAGLKRHNNCSEKNTLQTFLFDQDPTYTKQLYEKAKS